MSLLWLKNKIIMTSDEIVKTRSECRYTDVHWLSEIAYQLARLNEREEKAKVEIAGNWTPGKHKEFQDWQDQNEKDGFSNPHSSQLDPGFSKRRS